MDLSIPDSVKNSGIDNDINKRVLRISIKNIRERIRTGEDVDRNGRKY